MSDSKVEEVLRQLASMTPDEINELQGAISKVGARRPDGLIAVDPANPPPVDTAVLVTDADLTVKEKMLKRYFADISTSEEARVFSSGATSHTNKEVPTWYKHVFYDPEGSLVLHPVDWAYLNEGEAYIIRTKQFGLLVTDKNSHHGKNQSVTGRWRIQD